MNWTETGTIQGVSLVHIFHTLPVLPLMIPRHTTHYSAMESERVQGLSFLPAARKREREGGEPQLENGAEDGGVSERDDPILESGR